MKTLKYRSFVESVDARCLFELNAKLHRADVDKFIHIVFRNLAVWTEDRRVSIPGFGVFERRTRKARTLRNPQTKQLMQLPETSTLGFRAAKALKRGGK